MYPKNFDYFSPRSIDDALEILDRRDSEVKILAGGQSLIPSLKLRLLSLKGVVDITRIKELQYIRKDQALLRIGALTTSAILEKEKLIATSFPILKEAAAQIADPLVRNMGTVGGNLSHADPVNDLPAVMLALDASMTATSKRGTRKINADSFFVDSFKTALRPEEVLTDLEIPLRAVRLGGAYRKLKKASGGFTIAGVASCLSIADDDTISACRIAMTAVGPKALRAQEAEKALVGKKLTATVLDKVSELAVSAAQPHTDLNASEGYRRKILSSLVKEAVEISYNRGRGVS